jgi:hypothetical protein
VEFIEENGGGPGVRLKKQQQKKKTQPKLPNEPDLIDDTAGDAAPEEELDRIRRRFSTQRQSAA